MTRRPLAGWRRFMPGTQALLLAAAVLLLLAWWDPPIPGRDAARSLMVVIDITQSMAVTDQTTIGPDGGQQNLSRLAFVRNAFHRVLRELPCGTRLGWAVFTAHRSFVLMAPAEVCGNFQELQSTLAHIDYRMAWTGNSEVSKGLDSALVTAREMADRPVVVFVTDGHEAPPINARHRPPFHGEKGDVAGLIIGVGGASLAPIPKLDATGRVVGAWRAKDVLQVDPRTLGRDGTPAGEARVDDFSGPTFMVGATPGNEHLSALREDYLALLAEETGLGYLRLTASTRLRTALLSADLARRPAAANVAMVASAPPGLGGPQVPVVSGSSPAAAISPGARAVSPGVKLLASAVPVWPGPGAAGLGLHAVVSAEQLDATPSAR